LVRPKKYFYHSRVVKRRITPTANHHEFYKEMTSTTEIYICTRRQITKPNIIIILKSEKGNLILVIQVELMVILQLVQRIF